MDGGNAQPHHHCSHFLHPCPLFHVHYQYIHQMFLPKHHHRSQQLLGWWNRAVGLRLDMQAAVHNEFMYLVNKMLLLPNKQQQRGIFVRCLVEVNYLFAN
jgi:hypothetical protein